MKGDQLDQDFTGKTNGSENHPKGSCQSHIPSQKLNIPKSLLQEDCLNGNNSESRK